jgi:hypothetical protein
MIKKADVVLAVISRNDPDVYFQMGFAYALHKPLILLAEQNRPIPLDFPNLQTIFYDRNRMESIEQALADLLRNALDGRTQKSFSERQNARDALLRQGLGPTRSGIEFEFLVSEFLRSLGGVEVMGPGSKLDDSEVPDMVIWNNSIRSPLYRLGNPIIVECKNVDALPEDIDQVTRLMIRTNGHAALLFHSGQRYEVHKIAASGNWKGGTVIVIPVTEDVISSPSNLKDRIAELLSTVKK